MADNFSKRALLIAGPTASGKSALALKQALERGGVIINADALQVYRELRILTARPTIGDEAEVPHRLYGHVAAQDSYSVARWLADAKLALTNAWDQGLLPIVTGGTGLYFTALERGLADVPPIDLAVRARWRQFRGDAHGELKVRDPAAAARLNPNDRQRIVRALEVVDSTGTPLSLWQAQAQECAIFRNVAIERIFIDVPRAELYFRAEARLEQMVANGVLEEVESILGFDSALPMMKAIGVTEFSTHLRGDVSLEDAIVLAKTATRQYIKRQLTWWRRQLPDWKIVQ